MELDERKLKILQAIIRTYLDTGEPVGSRTISKYTDLNLSSATIRNEMSDLEDMGYIIQPHTSAGRIPSDKGYRLTAAAACLFTKSSYSCGEEKRPSTISTEEMESALSFSICSFTFFRSASSDFSAETAAPKAR